MKRLCVGLLLVSPLATSAEYKCLMQTQSGMFVQRLSVAEKELEQLQYSLPGRWFEQPRGQGNRLYIHRVLECVPKQSSFSTPGADDIERAFWGKE